MNYVIILDGQGEKDYVFIVCFRHMEAYLRDPSLKSISRLQGEHTCECCDVEDAGVESERRAERRNEQVLYGPY